MNQKSGQAIIFLLVVIVIGLFVVIWNFDLLRITNAKVEVLNATDAAAMAGARWQGVTLNMIGDLNLMQAAYLAIAAEEQRGWIEFNVPDEVEELHDLRSRLSFLGPLAAFAIAQQTASDNGAFSDPALAADLYWLAEEFRDGEYQEEEPYAGAFEDYADLLERIPAVAASFTPILEDDPWMDERFYFAIGQALGGVWCGLEDYSYELANYQTLDDWPGYSPDIPPFEMLDLKLEVWSSRDEGQMGFRRAPPTGLSSNLWELGEFLGFDHRGIFEAAEADPYRSIAGMFPFRPDKDIRWHVFDESWQGQWPKPRNGQRLLEADDEGDDAFRFPLRSAVQDRYNYMGAEAGFSMAVSVHRGILATDDNPLVGLVYKSKAKPFGFFSGEEMDWPPYYFGLVLPVFTDVRLVHSDIGDHVMSADFFHHVRDHLESVRERGANGLDPNCRYCQLLGAWESLDRAAGLRWLQEAESSPEDPFDPDNEGSAIDRLKGGASGGS